MPCRDDQSALHWSTRVVEAPVSVVAGESWLNCCARSWPSRYDASSCACMPANSSPTNSDASESVEPNGTGGATAGALRVGSDGSDMRHAIRSAYPPAWPERDAAEGAFACGTK